MCGCNEGCSDISLIEIPNGGIGPQGPVGPAGGLRKFTKQFMTADIEQELSITYTERTGTCGTVLAGCLDKSTTANPFIDIHIQVWNRGSLFSNWVLLKDSDLLVMPTVNYTTGDMTLTTGNNMGYYRIVIIG